MLIINIEMLSITIYSNGDETTHRAMVNVKPLHLPLNEWISCNYKTTQLLNENCLMTTLKKHSSTRYNMPNMGNQFS